MKEAVRPIDQSERAQHAGNHDTSTRSAIVLGSIDSRA
jgi:hypothetical protein